MKICSFNNFSQDWNMCICASDFFETSAH